MGKRFLLPSLYEVLTIVLLLTSNTPVDNADGVWHTAIGSGIKSPTHIPSYNKWYFEPPPGYKDRNFQWLSDFLLFRIYKSGGWQLLRSMKVLCVVFMAIILIGILQKERINPLYGGFLLIITLSTTGIMWSVRPTIFSNLLFALLVLILYSRNKKLFLAIPLIFLIWTNLHPAVFIGLYALLVFAIGDLMEKKRIDNQIWWVIPASILTMCINPYGTRIFRVPFILLQDRQMLGQIEEWLPYINIYFLIFLLFLFFIAVISKPSRPKLTLWILAFLPFPLISVRHQPLFGIAAFPFLIRQIKGINQKNFLTRWVNAVKKYDTGFHFPLYLSIAFLIVFVWNSHYPEKALDTQKYPVNAVETLKKLNAKRIYVSPLWTGYILLHKKSNQKVFYDWKEPYRKDLFYAVDILEIGRPQWKEVIKAYRIDGFIIPCNHPMADILMRDKGWRCVYHGKDGAMFVKQKT